MQNLYLCSGFGSEKVRSELFGLRRKRRREKEKEENIWRRIINGDVDDKQLVKQDKVNKADSAFYLLDNSFDQSKSMVKLVRAHTSYLSRKPREFSCKFFLAGVIFTDLTQKIGNLLCILP